MESLRLKKSAKREPAGFLRRVFLRASLEALSGGARTALRLSEQVDRLVTAISPKMIVSTYEGHAWERAIFSAARRASAGIQCIGYQHAAIFKLQHGALRKLGHPWDPDLILTAGAVSKGQIESSTKAHGIPVRILGSSRARANLRVGESTDPDVGGSDACLVLPEGIVSECLRLFEFSLKCAASMPDMRFVWRLHPLVPREALIEANPGLSTLPANVEFSHLPLEEDFKRTRHALYRGSTAIVRAACAGLQPIYLAQAGELTIDPLYELDAVHAKVADPAEFQAALRKKIATEADIVGRQTIIRYCESFYSPIEPAVILSMLSDR